MRIRNIRFPEDYEAVYTLWENAVSGIHLRRSDEKKEIAKKLHRDPDLFLVAEEAGQIVGTVMGGFDGRRGMMYHMAVAQPYRRRGVGTALMEALEYKFKEKGCIRYYLLVAKDNLEAVNFYQERGCEIMDLYALAKDL
jgi:ribosomal protein S18 acetylase RimI-like enzyme